MVKATRLTPEAQPEIRLDLTRAEALVIRRVLSVTTPYPGPLLCALDSVDVTFHNAVEVLDVEGRVRLRNR